MLLLPVFAVSSELIRSFISVTVTCVAVSSELIISFISITVTCV